MMSDLKPLFTRKIQWQPSGQGYPTKAAQSAIAFGFRQLHQAELVAFTTIANLRSRAVMRPLRMRSTLSWTTYARHGQRYPRVRSARGLTTEATNG